MDVYFDASALVKLFLEEEGSDLAAELWDGCDSAFSSRLTNPEVCAALAAARRHRDITERAHEAAEATWQTWWASMRPVELTPSVEQRAGQLAREQALRGADAVHLASALALEDPEVVVAVWDRRLHAGALAVGLPVAPLVLP